MTTPDKTFSDLSLFGSSKWAAHRLGLSFDVFRRKLSTLQGDGFPKTDGIIGLYIKEDVEAWVAKRRQILPNQNTGTTTEPEINFDAL